MKVIKNFSLVNEFDLPEQVKVALHNGLIEPNLALSYVALFDVQI